jgi:apolipoprotein N-acyltransferase
MSRIRAVEHGRAVVVVSTSGLTGVIAPDGSVVPGTSVGELQSGRYTVSVPQRDTLTVADRVGAWPEWLAALAGAVALLLAVRRGAVSGDTAGDGSATAHGEQSRQDAGVSDRHA